MNTTATSKVHNNYDPVPNKDLIANSISQRQQLMNNNLTPERSRATPKYTLVILYHLVCHQQNQSILVSQELNLTILAVI